MEIKYVSKVVRTGSMWLFVMILLTAGKVNAMGTLASLGSDRINGTITTDNPPTPGNPSTPPKPVPQTTGPQRNVAYFTQWSIYVRNYTVKDLDTSGAASKLTAINYAYAGISSDSKCMSLDAWADYQKPFTDTVSGQPDSPNNANALAGNFNQLKELKAKYPKLKVLISVGGWTFSGQFSTAAQPAKLQSFVQSCVDMFIKGNIPGLAPGAAAGIFDGIDIDWEYPAYQRTDSDSEGGYTSSPDDTQNYTAMLAEFRRQLGNNHLLTIGAPAGQDKYSKIQLNKISRYLDWINLMTFDYHGSWNTQTDIQAPLYCDPKIEKIYCINYTINGYLEAEVPPNMINLGLPFYGHGWTNVPNNNNGLYQSSTKPAPGLYPNAPGINDYKVLEQLKSQGYTPHRDNLTKGFWIFNGSTLWSYDDPQEVTIKVNYARSKGLGGAFCWPIDGDDSKGTLLNAMIGSHGTS